MAEQGTHNPLVAGSSPAPRTRCRRKDMYRFQFPERRAVPETTDQRMAAIFEAARKLQDLCEDVYSEDTALTECTKCVEVIEICEQILRSYPASILQAAATLVDARNRRKGLTVQDQ